MVDILAEGQLAGRCGAAFKGCDAHEVLLDRDRDGLRHLAKERHHALENADQNRALAAIVLGNLRADLTDAGVDVLFGDENPFNILLHVKFVNHCVSSFCIYSFSCTK